MTGRLKVYDADTGLWQYVDGAGAQANLLRFVPIPINGIGPAAATANVPQTHVSPMTFLPTNAIGVSMIAYFAATVTSVNHRLTIFGYDAALGGTTRMAEIRPDPNVSQFGSQTISFVALGGDRQFDYSMALGTAATITPSIVINGYWVNDISTAIGSGGGSVIGYGPTFPGAPLVNDRFFRTSDHIEYFWDGTRWLSTVLMTFPISTQQQLVPITLASTFRSYMPGDGSMSIWVEKLIVGWYISSPNDGSNYWNALCFGTNINSQSLAPSTVLSRTANVNSVWLGANNWVQMDFTKIGSPGGAYPLGNFTYRYIGA